MDKKLPTIKEIAERLKVSTSTVSRALHDHPSIGLKTKMMVQSLAKELKYEPNQTAIFFKQGRTSTIGVILPRLSEEFFSLAISGIEDYALTHKYNVLIGQSYNEMEREIQIVETMKNNRVDGLIVSLAKNTYSYEHFEHLKNYNIPVVFFDCVPDLPDSYSVWCNLHKGTVQSVNFLARKGHQRIALLNGPRQLQASIQRKAYYLEGLKENQLQEDPTMIVETDLSKESTVKAIQHLMDLDNPPTAIIAFNDYVALDAMRYVRSKNKKVNEDICFVSFAHLPLCNYLDNPPLASVEQFPYEQGYKAMELMYDLLNKKGNLKEQAQIILESELIARNG